MLSQISVKNIALIDEVNVELGDGLNIITGETGAGKSILLGAVNLALGAKSAKEAVRDPEENASVDLVFSDVSDAVVEALHEMDIDASDREVMISRRFSAGGRGSSRINGVNVVSAQVKQIASLLIDIHGQHEHQSLLNDAFHIEILDRFAPEMSSLRQQMQGLWTRSLEISKELAELTANEKEKDRLLALLQFESDEIEAAGLEEGEEEELNETRKRLINSGRLKEDSYKAFAALRCGEDEPDAVALTSAAASFMEGLSRFDPEFFENRLEALQNALSIMDDVATDLRYYSENIEEDEEKLEQIEERLDLIHKLKSKYGRDIREIFQYKAKTDAEIEKLNNISEAIEKLRSEQTENLSGMESQAFYMTGLRKAAAARISTQITEILKTLQFSDPSFVIEISPKALSAKGADDVVFKIRSNVGEPVLPLSQIASGGEIARVMLAIKTVLAEQDEIGTLIFDEIDTGISGRTAQSVAEKMSLIAGYRQVIAVTHLPQLAAMADCHICISKEEENGKTYTRVRRLTDGREIDEIARMVGGLEITEAVFSNACEMKKLATQWKKEHVCRR